MRAVSKCPKCGVDLETNNTDCIEGEFAVHDCGDEENEGGEIVDGVLWVLCGDGSGEPGEDV